MGGGEVISQVLSLGLADELVLHLAPLVLARGRRCSPRASGRSR